MTQPGTVGATMMQPDTRRPSDFTPVADMIERFGDKPLVDVGYAVGTPGEKLGPVERGFSNFASGMTTPVSLGLLAAAGPLEELPVAAQRTVSAIFGAQMGKGLYDQSKPFREAVAREDWDTAAELGAQMIPEAAMTFAAGAHALKGTPQAVRLGVGELARRTGATGGLLEQIGREPLSVGTLDSSKGAWEPVARGQTVADLNAQRARDVQANAAAARGMAKLEGRVNLKDAPVGPRALPPARPTPQETIGGQPINVRMFPSDEAPLITPEPVRTPEGAIIAGPSPIGERKQLPAAGATPPPDESEFLAGKPVQVPRLTSAVPVGPIESYAEGYTPKFSASEPVRSSSPTPEIDFRPQTGQPPAGKLKGKAAAAAAQAEARIQAGLRVTMNDEKVPQFVRDMARQQLELRQNHRVAAPARLASTVTPPAAPEPVQLEKFNASPYQRQQAQLATNRLRNPVEREFAQSYLRARLEGGMAPEAISSLSRQRAGQITDKIEEFLGKEQPKKVSERFAPDVVSEAEGEMHAAAELAGSFDRPGRYMADAGEMGDLIHNPTWYGVKSSRPHVAGQFPWYADEEITPAKLQAAIRRGEGADYERIVGKIAEGIHAERESARPVIEEYAPQLRELADQVRDIDPEKAQLLTELVEGRTSVGIKNLRDYIERNVADANAAALFSKAVDEASRAASEPSSSAEPAAMARGPHEAANILPGLEEAVTENQRAAGQHQAEQLTEQINRPADSIESAAGEMELK